MSSGPIILRAADLPDILEDERPLLKLAFTEESLTLFRRVLNLKFFQVRALIERAVSLLGDYSATVVQDLLFIICKQISCKLV